jgi:uncharacterized protein (DUF885 family)
MNARLIAALVASIIAGMVTSSCGGRDAAARTRAVADEYWGAYVERYPEIATYQGVSKAPHGRLTDNSLKALAAWRAREDGWLVELRELQDSSVKEAPKGSLLAATAREALEASVAARICRSELWNLSDTWPGWHKFMSDWIAAQPGWHIRRAPGGARPMAGLAAFCRQRNRQSARRAETGV